MQIEVSFVDWREVLLLRLAGTSFFFPGTCAWVLVLWRLLVPVLRVVVSLQDLMTLGLSIPSEANQSLDSELVWYLKYTMFIATAQMTSMFLIYLDSIQIQVPCTWWLFSVVCRCNYEMCLECQWKYMFHRPISTNSRASYMLKGLKVGWVNL